MERDIYFDPTGIKDDAKQSSLNDIYSGIERLLTSDEEDFSMQYEISDISLDDIDDYLNFLIDNQSIDIKLGRLTPVVINNEDLFYLLCDRLSIGGESPHLLKIYFLEYSDGMLTIIPILTEDGNITVRIEDSKNSPKEIRRIWEDVSSKPSLDKMIDGVTLRRGW
ncbi:MAG: hypothetical protein PHP08_04015 [Candidatus Dojkabacteria bacterium]|nr:hypothetical protein [Candidatus Dojkabacteria bacterium]